MSSIMMMNVLGIKPWEITDEKTGEVKRGASVFVGQEPEDSDSEVLGWEVMKFSCPLAVYEHARKLKMKFPSECSVEVSLKLGAAGKGQLQVLGFSDA